jgi:ring-1,2-phenylacetyl-CoA epoxidase subunit PaaC
MIGGLREIWPDVAELQGTDPKEAFDDAMRAVDHVLDLAGLDRPSVGSSMGRGRDGTHTEAFVALLAEMQSLAREHPLGRW